MIANKSYLFTSERLGFRNWIASDIDRMSEINSDKKVMEFFPCVQSNEQTKLFVKRMQKHFDRTDFCYFAVDVLKSAELIGFIGLAEQTFEADFTPCVDIGWRLHTSAWNKGYATEGAKACL
jgi:RimJ/RimL family protein N-acetyltransferase